MLNTKNYYTKIYAVTILEDLVKQKWNLLDLNNKNGIRDFLINQLMTIVKDPSQSTKSFALIQKINIVIVMIAKNEWTTTWTTFMTEICNSSMNDVALCENNLKILKMLK
jgi:exportin-1